MKPKLYIIVSDVSSQPNRESFDLLAAAAKKQGYEVVPLESAKANFSKIPKLNNGDFLYRKSTDQTSARLEALLMNDELITFYGSQPSLVQRSRSSWSGAITLQKNGINIIPTVFHLDLNSQKTLAESVESLGGFPVIVKSSGGAHGNGVFRFDSIESLWSARPLLMEYASEEKAVLRKYIKHDYHARLIVVGGRVVDSIEYIAPKNDFRTNNLESPKVNPRKFPPEAENLAVLATKTLNLEFAGVDLLFDEPSKQYYVAEVNFPCNFSRCQLATGVNIADILVDFLQAKRKASGI